MKYKLFIHKTGFNKGRLHISKTIETFSVIEIIWNKINYKY